jgi:hypothetical protein
MSTSTKLFRSSSGFISPYFIVDIDGNLITQTVTVTGSRVELTEGSFISYGGQPLLTKTALGSSVTTISGTLTGLNVAGTVAINGNLQVTGGTNTLINPTVTGNIDNVNIGLTTPASGRFSSLSMTGALTLTQTGSVTISPTGPVAISPTGTATISPSGSLTLGTSGQTTAFNGNVSMTASQNITISPTGTGLVTINPITTGTLDNITVGNTTPQTGKFTNITLTTPDERWGSNVSQAPTKRYVEGLVLAFNFFGMS